MNLHFALEVEGERGGDGDGGGGGGFLHFLCYMGFVIGGGDFNIFFPFFSPPLITIPSLPFPSLPFPFSFPLTLSFSIPFLCGNSMIGIGLVSI